jgi:hypothetical protein
MPPDAPARLIRHVFALLNEAKITDRRERLNLYRWILHDPSVNSTNDLNETELDVIATMLKTWKRQGELESQAREHAGGFEEGGEVLCW